MNDNNNITGDAASMLLSGTGTPRGASRHHPKGTGGKGNKTQALQALQHHIKVPVFLTTPAITASSGCRPQK